jgi:hypothetical protein
LKAVLATLILAILTVTQAHADEHGTDARAFMDRLRDFKQTCTAEICELPNEVKLIYSVEKALKNVDPTISSLTKIAWEQAQVWADTILEGDFHAAGDTRLDAVYTLYKDGEFLGYRITYSEKAWNTSECTYNGTPNSLASCPEGRIIESSYVSPTLKTFVADENQFAVFLPN